MTAEAKLSREERKKRIFAIIGGASGNLVEWYDFYVYSFGALYFASAFFPKGDRTSQLLSTAAVFAVGFFMRPIGGWLFGLIGDKWGRRNSLMIAVLVMCVGSFAVAVLPTYETIGVAAPIALLVIRMVQGLSVGGEYGASATYMSEIAIGGRRGFYASFQYVTLIGGQLLATTVIVVLQQFLSQDQMYAWGWRVPFAIGGLAAIVAFQVTRGLHETSSEETRKHAHAGSLIAVLRHHWRAFLIVVGFTAGGSLSFYTFTTYMPKYLVNTAGFSAPVATETMNVVLLAYMLMQPLFGYLSDLIGRRNSMLCFGLFATIATVPLLAAIATVKTPEEAFTLITLALAIVSFYTSISGLVKAELFPAPVRALGVGLSYAVANAIFGGTAEYVALWFKQDGHESWFYWYVSGLCAVTLLVAFIMPDARKKGYLQGHGTVD